MNKIIITVTIIFIAIIAGILLINAYDKETDVTEAPTKVGVILNGYKDDKSWSQSHYEGLVKTAQQLSADCCDCSDSVFGL